MFSKILIANRGEIACRVIRTAQRMGIRTVAVYSDADREALHVAMADEAVHIGASASQQSYLRGERVIAAALDTGAQAIHPGYGFLSENAEFARACAEHNLVFIGPPVAAIEAMGSKSAAKTIMQAAKVPLVPGYHGDDQSSDKLRHAANDMGYPVLLKAVAGGGGKGMRQVWSADEFDAALTMAKSEALASFDNDDMLVEKYLTQPRHVEVQVFCDQHGGAVYLFERDCSVQRRHQKIIEEAPAPGFDAALRSQIGEAAVKAALAIDYVGAGTVEFLYDTDGAFYFMEMNTRLQVEHPVTEMITGQDLVEWQLRVANGEALPLLQEQLQFSGHAFEARIYAEDPNNDFLPTAGTLSHLQTPAESAHVRVDTGVLQGDAVSPFYDPMIAKLIVHDENRDRALARLSKALTEYQISGVTTNIEFLYTLANNPAFAAAELDTGFIEKHHDELFDGAELQPEKVLPLASLYLLQRTTADGTSPWHSNSAWRLNQPAALHCDICLREQNWHIPVHRLNDDAAQGQGNGSYELLIDEQRITVSGYFDGQQLHAEIDGHQQRLSVVEHEHHITLFTDAGAVDVSVPKPDLGLADDTAGGGDFRAPMNGTIVEVGVAAGQTVTAGDMLIIMEAMKMQHTISAPTDGVVAEVFCNVGELVDGGSELLSFAAGDD